MNVTAGVAYRIGVWAAAGVGTYALSTPDAIVRSAVDATGATAPAWRSFPWTPGTTGRMRLTMRSTGGGDLRFDLRRASDNAWVADALGTTNPKSLAANVTAGVSYRIGVWAASGRGDLNIDAVAAKPPNILIVMTDDQRRDSLANLPRIRRWLADGGTTFTQGYVTTPSCCPSRATTLTGRYDHNNGVRRQTGPAFDESTSIARYLKGAGYRTGHIGKYVHYYKLAERAPWWDRWTYWQGGYQDVFMNVDGVVKQSSGYSTRIAFDTAISYVNAWEASDAQPWLMLVAPTAPHLVGKDPPPAEPQYATTPVGAFPRFPSTFEANTTDKPPFIYCCAVTEDYVSRVHTGMTRALLSIDDGVDRLMQRLEAAGELDDTLVFFYGDNGWLYGEHNLTSKFLPYTNSVGVPFIVRWPNRIPAGVTDTRMVANVDVAPTVLAAAGVAPPAVPMDGRDIMAGSRRARRLTEYWQDDGNVPGIPDWASVTTPAYAYTEYYQADSTTVRFREYYDLVNDPHELVNLLADGTTANDPNVTAISAQLRADRACKGAACP